MYNILQRRNIFCIISSKQLTVVFTLIIIALVQSITIFQSNSTKYLTIHALTHTITRLNTIEKSDFTLLAEN